MTATAARPNRRRRWLIAAGAVGLLLVVGWFVLTSGPVLKALVLPRVAKALHADLTVEDLSLSPFSGIELKNVKLTPVGGQTLAEIAHVKVRYQLMAFLVARKIVIDEVEVDKPVVTIRQHGAESSNLSAWLAKLHTDEPKSDGEPTPQKRLILLIGKVAIHDGKVRHELTRPDGANELAAIESLELSADQIRNGGITKAKLSASFVVETRDPAGALVDSLKAAVDSSGNVTLDGELVPGDLDSRLAMSITEATGRYARSAGVGAVLSARGSVQKLDELTLSFLRGPTETGRLHATGGYDVATGSGAFDLSVSKLPPVVLELAAAKSGLDFELADFSSTNRITISQRGRVIAATGEWRVNGLTATKDGGTTPVLDIALNYAAELDATAGRLSVGSLTLAARQNGQPLMDVHVSEPLHYAWRGPTEGNADGAMSLNLEQLRLGDWRQFVGDLPVDGILTGQIDLGSPDTAQGLTIRASTSLNQAQLTLGTNRPEQLTAVLNVEGALSPTRELQFSRLSASVAQAGNPLAELSGTARVGLTNFTASAQTTIKTHLAALAALAGELPAKVSGGTATLTSTADYSAKELNTSGTLWVAGLGADFAGARFKQIGAELPFELTRSSDVLRWSLPDAAITENGAVALQLSSSGRLNLTNYSGTIELALPLINERLINPFLAGHSPQQRLLSAQASVVVQGELPAHGRQRWSLASQSTNIVLVGSNNVAHGPALGSRSVLEVELGPATGEMRLKRWEGHLFADGQPAGELTAQGSWQTDGPAARFNLKLAGVNEHALAPLAALLIDGRRIEKANLTVETVLEYDATKPSQASLGIELRNVKLHDPLGRLPEHPRDADLRLQARIASNRVDLAEGFVQVTPTGGLSNRVELTGWVDLSQPQALRGDLSLRSPGIDLSPLYGLLERRDGNTNDAPDMEAASASVRSVDASDAAPARPVDRLDLALDFRQVRLRELTISNWVAQATVFSNSFDLGLFSLRLNEAPINARLHTTNTAGAVRFDVAAEIEQLRLAPVLRTFYPDWHGRAEAEVFAAVHLRGAARDGQNLWPVAIGDLHIGITNANYQPLNRRWQTTLRPVALLLQSPELFSSPISWANQHVRLTNQTLALMKSTIISDAYVLDTATTVPLAADFNRSAIPRTPANLYLNRTLVTQLGFLKGADTNQFPRYVQLPTFMHLGGTIGEPQVEIDKLKLTGLTLGKAGDFLGGSAGDLLQKAGGVTEKLGGIVSGRKLTGGEKADANLVSKGIEGVFDAVGGILGGSGKAVEKGTGAVTGTKAVEGDVLNALLAAFDWPRIFTNAPNRLPAVQ